MQWTVYLSGEIHTDWRQQIMQGAESHRLPIIFNSAVTDHAASDAAVHERSQQPTGGLAARRADR